MGARYGHPSCLRTPVIIAGFADVPHDSSICLPVAPDCRIRVRTRCEVGGARQTLHKPFAIEELLSAVR
jgi:hypothetical protein